MNTTKSDYSRKWLVLSSVAMGVFLATIDGSIVNIALPILVTSLNTDFAMVQWVVLGYLLTITTLLLGIGRLADMYGKKKIYLAGILIFSLGSLLCGLSTNVGWLITFRIVQAVGGAMMMALGTAITTEAFPDYERGKALGISGLIVSIGIIAGPAMGGLILGSFSWHWIFFVNLPIGLAGILMVSKFVPNIKPVGEQKFDFSGAITLLISLTAFLLALTFGQQEGFDKPLSLALFLVFLIFMIWFVLIQVKKKQPMVDLTMFSNKLFSINLVTGFLTFIANSGIILLMPFYLENILQHDPQTAGFMMAVFPIAMGISAPLAGGLSDKFGTRALTVIGLAITALAYWGVGTLTENTSTFGYILRFIPMGVGMGIFQSPNNSAIMGSVPKSRLGVASGLLAITRTLGQTTGISILGAFWAARIFFYNGSRSLLDVTLAPIHLQMTSLQNVFLLSFGIIVAALLLSLYALINEKNMLKNTSRLVEGG